MKPQQLTQLLLLIAALTVAALVTSFLVKPKYGLDIQGGARVVMEADTSKMPPGRAWNQDTRNAVIHTLENRVNSNGVAEPVLSTKGDKQFVIELPAVRNEREILEQLQNTAQLQFYYSPEWRTQRNTMGRYALDRAPGGHRGAGTVPDYRPARPIKPSATCSRLIRTCARFSRTGQQSGRQGGDRYPAARPPSPDLSASGGTNTAKVTAEDAPKLAALAEEAQNFNSFLGAARMELTGSDILPTAKSGFASAGNDRRDH